MNRYRDEAAIRHRLESWRRVVETGLPAEYAELAPRVVKELEAELAAQRITRGNQ